MNSRQSGTAVPEPDASGHPLSGARLVDGLWGILAWLALVCGVCGGLAVALLVPGLARRRRWVSRCARLPFRLAGIPVRVRGTERLPDSQCIVVANHASYLDGILLQGFLPPRFSFVIKGEMLKVPLASFLLRRIGARFVDRFSTAAARDARTLLRAAEGGESLAFFPEGTFVREPGLARFRAGAFVAAMRATLPVTPVVIRGSRGIFPSGALLPRRGRLEIDVLDPIPPGAHADSAALAGAARRRILELLDEPDLAPRGMA